MNYEIRKNDSGQYLIYRVGPLANREVWNAIQRSWDTPQSWGTPYSTENSVRETVRRNKFFPCVIVQEEILPEPEEKESEIPSLTFKDLTIGERYIYFMGSDPSAHHIFQKLNATNARNLYTGGTVHDIDRYKTGKVIRVRF